MSAKYKEYISKKLQTHHDELIKRGFSPIYIALVGSQNYGIDTEDSDVDTKAIVLPTLRAVAANERPVSQTVHFDNGEQCDVKDIREMVSCWKKQNINFLEVLFTDYYIVNKYYARFLKELREMAEDIAHYDPIRAIKSMAGQVNSKLSGMTHISPSSKEKIERFGYDPKQLCHLVRFCDFCLRYYNKKTFKECLIPSDKEYLIDLKKGIFNLEDALTIAKIHKQIIDTLIKRIESDSFVYKIDYDLDKKLEDIVYQILAYYFDTGVI